MKPDKKKIIILLIIALVISFAGITDIGNTFAGTVRTATVQPESKKTETGEKDKNKTKDKKKTKEGKKQKNKSKKIKKVWVPAVYKIVKHPAVKKQKISVHWVCQCGEVFNSDEEWQAHRPKPWDDKHTFAEQKLEKEEVIVKKAWKEKVLVKKGYWKYE